MKKFLTICLAVLLAVLMSGSLMTTCLVFAEESEEIEQVEETPEETEETQPNANDDEKQHTFDEFLAYTQELADTYGYGEQYAKAVANIKNALTQKQFTIAMIGDVVLLVFLAFNILKKAKKDKKLDELEKQLKKLTTGTNELVDATNGNSLKLETAEDTLEAIKCVAVAMRGFISCVKLPEETKQQILNVCDKAVNITEK